MQTGPGRERGYMADQDKKDNAKGASSKTLLIGLALTNLLSLGGLAYFVVTQGGDTASASEMPMGPGSERDAAVVGPTADLGTYNITLADPGQNRYLKAVLKARVTGSEVLEEIEGRTPELRDRVIDYLSSLTVKETQGARSKSVIRANLEKRINNILRTGEVESIFLTEFVTQ